jgi:hypothetical protein
MKSAPRAARTAIDRNFMSSSLETAVFAARNGLSVRPV